MLADIESFNPGPAGSWLPLDNLLGELFTRDESLTSAIEPLLHVFERFPRHDGFEVMWSIVHGVEHIAGYEPSLVQSVKRCATEMGVTMLRRLVNPGVERVGDVDVAPLIVWAQERAPEIDYTV